MSIKIISIALLLANLSAFAIELPQVYGSEEIDVKIMKSISHKLVGKRVPQKILEKHAVNFNNPGSNFYEQELVLYTDVFEPQNVRYAQVLHKAQIPSILAPFVDPKELLFPYYLITVRTTTANPTEDLVTDTMNAACDEPTFYVSAKSLSSIPLALSAKYNEAL